MADSNYLGGRLGPPLGSLPVEKWDITRLAARVRFPQYVLSKVDLSSYMDEVTREVVYSIDALVLTGPQQKIVRTFWYEVPATWWDAFKMEAIKWGNPFFDPAKVRMRKVEAQVEWRYKEVFPDGGKIAISDDHFDHGYVQFVRDPLYHQERREQMREEMDYARFFQVLGRRGGKATMGSEVAGFMDGAEDFDDYSVD